MPYLTRSQKQQVLDIALMDEDPVSRKRAKAIFAILKKAWNVQGYVNALEQMLKIATRTNAAIKALEERTLEDFKYFGGKQ